MNTRAKIVVAAITGLLFATAGTASANADTTTPPTPSPSGGIVTVCPGIQVSLDDATGEPLPIAEQQIIISDFVNVCTHSQSQSTGGIGLHSLAVTPMGTDLPFGYLAAHINVAVGSLTVHATASGMPTGTYRTLTCEYQVGSGAYTSCGSAAGSGSTLSTLSAQICPLPGQQVTAMAFLNVGSADYYDIAYATTK